MFTENSLSLFTAWKVIWLSVGEERCIVVLTFSYIVLLWDAIPKSCLHTNKRVLLHYLTIIWLKLDSSLIDFGYFKMHRLENRCFWCLRSTMLTNQVGRLLHMLLSWLVKLLLASWCIFAKLSNTALYNKVFLFICRSLLIVASLSRYLNKDSKKKKNSTTFYVSAFDKTL